MKCLPRVGILSCFLLVSSQLAAQTRPLYGIVKDAQTLKAVPATHLITSRTGTFSDEEGRFIIPVSISDTVCFSHVSYHRQCQTITSLTRNSLIIFLTPNNTLLREIVVRGLPTEEQFKDQLLGLNLSPSREEVYAVTNFANAHKLFLSGYVSTMNSRDNYRRQLQEPSGITLFSSGPTKGFFRAMKNLLRDKNLLISPPRHPGPSVLDAIITPASDSLRVQ